MKEITKYVDEDCADSDEFEEGFNCHSFHYHIQKLVTAIHLVLVGCHGVCSQQKVIEKFLGHPCIKPSLSLYYLPLKETAAELLLIECLKLDLAGVKGIQSREKLASKDILFSTTVRKNVENFAKD